jgi:hypothetical protein
MRMYYGKYMRVSALISVLQIMHSAKAGEQDQHVTKCPQGRNITDPSRTVQTLHDRVSFNCLFS